MDKLAKKIEQLPLILIAVRTFALFQAYNVLVRDAVQPVLFALVASVAAVLTQIGTGHLHISTLKRLSLKRHSVILLLGAWYAVNQVILITSLAKLHPLRLAVGEHFELVLAFGLLRQKDNQLEAPSHRRRNAFILVVGAIICLGWASNLNNYAPQDASPEDLTNLMDSVGGMLLLGCYAVSELFRKRTGKDAVIDLHDDTMMTDALVPLVASAVLLPLVVVVSAFDTLASSNVSWVSLIVSGFILTGLPALRSGINRRRSIQPHLKIATAAITAAVLHVSFHRHYSEGQAVEDTHPLLHGDNILVVLCAILMSLGVWLLSSGQGTAGIDETQLLFTTTSTAETSLISSILENPKERKLFGFFCLTLFFMFVELLYGIHVNSLGLVSDSFHMLLDSASLAIGLYAAHMAKWEPNASHPFGYGRYEILSGFTNGILLLFIGGYIFAEAIGRVFEPPTIDQNYLLGVSILGLLINIAGIALFHSDGHGHSHGGHGHSHGAEGDDVNLRAVYLHILADFLGSVSVIFSSIIVSTTGWMAADPICSAFISLLIFMAAMPLIKSTGEILLQRSPQSVSLGPLQTQIERLNQVQSVQELHVWVQATTPEPVYVVNAIIIGVPGSQCGALREQVVKVLRSSGVTAGSQFSIQVSAQ